MQGVGREKRGRDRKERYEKSRNERRRREKGGIPACRDWQQQQHSSDSSHTKLHSPIKHVCRMNNQLQITI